MKKVVKYFKDTHIFCNMSEFIVINPTKHEEGKCVNRINYFTENTITNFNNKQGDKSDLGEHYKQGDIEVIDFIDSYNLNFNLGNAIKYIARCNYKKDKCPNCCVNTSTKVNDLRKAIWYIEREIKKSTTCKTNH